MRFISKKAKQLMLLLGSAGVFATGQQVPIPDLATRGSQSYELFEFDFSIGAPQMSDSSSWMAGADLIPKTSLEGSFLETVGCYSCTAVTKSMQFILRRMVVHAFLVDAGKLLCILVTHYDRQACFGLID